MHWTLARTICLLIGLTFLSSCIYFAWYAHDWRRKFDVWMTEVPVRLPVDLSLGRKTFEATFTHTCSMAHGQGIFLRAWKADGTPVDLFKESSGIYVKLRVEPLDSPDRGRDEDGEFYPNQHTADKMEPGAVLLARWPLGRAGQYRIVVQSVGNDPELRGLRQEILIRNELCGLELMPAALAKVIAVASGLIGLAFALPSGLKICFEPNAETSPIPTPSNPS